MDKMLMMFPGVGSQYVGMCKEFYQNFPIFRETVDQAGEILGKDLSDLCFSAERKNELSQLENAQLAILTMSVGVYRVYMQEIGIEPAYCMGHSLGEYSALCCAGVLEFRHALELVRHRGSIISEVSTTLAGTMMWVINLDIDTVETVCAEVNRDGGENARVHISAYDCPTQSSISGHNDAVMTAARRLEKEGAIVYPLKMSGPFHSPLMEEAARRMKSVLESYTYSDPHYPVIANHNARPYEGKDSVADNLSKQLISPIRWRASIEYLQEQGVTTAVEIGPKDVLKFLMKKNSDTIEPHRLDRPSDLDTLTDKCLIKEDEYLQLMGRCLGIAVSTKNHNDDPDEYQNSVVKPYTRIADTYEELKNAGKIPTVDQVQDAVETIRNVLTAKKVPRDEQRTRFSHLFGGRILKNRALGDRQHSGAA